ncbi:hypothetical protein NKH18_45115 [Streptomyces sp. M10(2022)]
MSENDERSEPDMSPQPAPTATGEEATAASLADAGPGAGVSAGESPWLSVPDPAGSGAGVPPQWTVPGQAGVPSETPTPYIHAVRVGEASLSAPADADDTAELPGPTDPTGMTSTLGPRTAGARSEPLDQRVRTAPWWPPVRGPSRPGPAAAPQAGTGAAGATVLVEDYDGLILLRTPRTRR